VIQPRRRGSRRRNCGRVPLSPVCRSPVSHQIPYHPPPHCGLDIVFIDDTMIVLDKPAGLLSVPGRGDAMQDSLASRVQAEFPEALIVHRLDLATSGLIVMARGATHHRTLSLAFQGRDVDKRYVAVVAGEPAGDIGEIDLPLICDWPNRPRQKVDHEVGKPSLTRWRVLAREGSRSRLELEPVTGRSHQLRVHLAEIGHAILGDPLYAQAADRDAAPRLLLHAAALSLPHPTQAVRLDLRREAPF